MGKGQGARGRNRIASRTSRRMRGSNLSCPSSSCLASRRSHVALAKPGSQQRLSSRSCNFEFRLTPYPRRLRLGAAGRMKTGSASRVGPCRRAWTSGLRRTAVTRTWRERAQTVLASKPIEITRAFTIKKGKVADTIGVAQYGDMAPPQLSQHSARPLIGPRASAVLVVLGLVLCACTPLRGIRSSEVSGSDTDAEVSAGHVNATNATDEVGQTMTGTPAGERCETQGQVRCAAAARQRERCEEGAWVRAVPCGGGEVCRDTEGDSQGACVAVAEMCRGNAGAVLCDGAGVLYRCGDDGTIESTERCQSARHCQLGLAATRCALCLPVEYRCQGDVLERCDPDGRGFGRVEACPSDSCDAQFGTCTGSTCSEARSICVNDALKMCARGESEYRDVTQCEPGLCNAEAATCDACVPGIDSCDGDTALRCAADTGALSRVDCSAGQGHCVGAGRCVQCASDADCADPGACELAYCDAATGVCETQNQTEGSPCEHGSCASDGRCVACVADTDCEDPGSCLVRHCDTTSGQCDPRPADSGVPCGAGRCDGRGACMACVRDADCPDPGACQTRHCDAASGSCQPRAAARGTSCGTGVCDGEGACAGCNSDADCPRGGACQTQRCDVSERLCVRAPGRDGEHCSSSFGDGLCLSGQCVQCRADSDCSGAGACQEDFCRSSDNTCQRRARSTGTNCGGERVCDAAGRCVECTADLHCGANALCLDNACQCQLNFVDNPASRGCNFDECAQFDDNRCGTAEGTGNSCHNTEAGYTCSCGPGWSSGSDQCFQSGTGRFVKNGASWDVFPQFGVVCENAFDANTPCPEAGQLTMLNVCGLPDTDPNACSSIVGRTDGLRATGLARVDHTGSLEDFGRLPNRTTDRITQLQVGQVIAAQTLSALVMIRITAFNGEGMTYDWAAVWRDTCWRPGGLTCAAACNCPGGS